MPDSPVPQETKTDSKSTQSFDSGLSAEDLALFLRDGGQITSSRVTPEGLTIYRVTGAKGAEITARLPHRDDPLKKEIK